MLEHTNLDSTLKFTPTCYSGLIQLKIKPEKIQTLMYTENSLKKNIVKIV